MISYDDKIIQFLQVVDVMGTCTVVLLFEFNFICLAGWPDVNFICLAGWPDVN